MQYDAAKRELDSQGFAILPAFTTTAVVNNLLTTLEPLNGRPGIRHLNHHSPAIADFLRSPALQECLRALSPNSFPVRTIFFDKTPATNWKVPWHQDLTICVKERHNLPGFTAWSIKEGVTHVQPPTEILERMFTIRLSLDHCGPENGPLRVLPGSHKHGRLTPQQISRFQSETEPVTCIVPQAGALLMKPLLLHSSSAATEPSHRRVLHIELASGTLPKPLAWAKQLFDSPSIAEPMIRFP